MLYRLVTRLAFTADERLLLDRYRRLNEQDRRYTQRIVEAMFLTTPRPGMEHRP